MELPTTIQLKPPTENEKSLTSQGYSKLYLTAIREIEATTSKSKDLIKDTVRKATTTAIGHLNTITSVFYQNGINKNGIRPRNKDNGYYY